MTDDVKKLVLEKLDRLSERQESQNMTLVRLTVSVEDHVRRTNLLEARVSADRDAVRAELKPLKDQYHLLRNGAIVISALCTTLMMGLTALHLLGKI